MPIMEFIKICNRNHDFAYRSDTFNRFPVKFLLQILTVLILGILQMVGALATVSMSATQFDLNAHLVSHCTVLPRERAGTTGTGRVYLLPVKVISFLVI